MKLSPSNPTVVLEPVVAVASTSAKCALSLAERPNAVSASVTMSDTVPKSSPDAAARFIMPGRPSIICCAFHPAMPMYSMALAASLAPNTLSAPICMAACLSISTSSLVAPDIAPTRLICASNSMPVFIALDAISSSGRVMYSVNALPSPESVCSSAPSFVSSPALSSPNALSDAPAPLNAAVNPDVSSSRYAIASPRFTAILYHLPHFIRSSPCRL